MIPIDVISIIGENMMEWVLENVQQDEVCLVKRVEWERKREKEKNGNVSLNVLVF